MIFIAVKWDVLPEKSVAFLEAVKDFTDATRAEPGNLFFEWSIAADEPNTFYLIEAFADGAAEAHVGSDHFNHAVSWLPDWVATTPQIINTQVDGDTWSPLAEIQPRERQRESA